MIFVPDGSYKVGDSFGDGLKNEKLCMDYV